MTDILDLIELPVGTRRFVGHRALLEAIEVERLVMVPGLNALLAQPSRFGLTADTSSAVASTLRRHVQTIGLLQQMAVDSLNEHRCTAKVLESIPVVLPVRALHVVCTHPRRVDDPDARAIVNVAFMLVAAFALTDPTNCTTASPALHLVPPPLHRDRRLLEKVLRQAISEFDVESVAMFELFVSKASAFFGAVGHDDEFTLLRYNSHALRTCCRQIGLGPNTRIATQP